MFYQTWTNTLTFDEAVARHGMLQQMLEQIKHGRPGGIKGAKVKKLIVQHLTDSWSQCMGFGDTKSQMASAVRSTIPLNYVPLMRIRSGIPTAYFTVKLCEEMLASAQLGNDLTDDTELRRLVTEAFAKFEWRRKKADKLAEGFGFDRSDAWAQMRKIEDKSGQVTEMMAKIAALAGRMYKEFRNNGIPSKCNDPQEVEGVETGGDFERILEDEAAAIGIDPEVMARFAEEQTQQYRMEGEATKSRGPLVITRDQSGSMHGARQVWAAACAVALARVAIEEGRAVRAVHFSNATHVHDVRPDNADDMRILAESHFSGGTNIGVAVDVSISQVGDLEKAGKEGADIVFITDGLDRYEREPFERMKTLGIGLWTVAIQVDIKAVSDANRKQRGGHYGASGWLYEYARAYVYIDNAMMSNTGASIGAAMQLREAALDNTTREAEEQDGR